MLPMMKKWPYSKEWAIFEVGGSPKELPLVLKIRLSAQC